MTRTIPIPRWKLVAYFPARFSRNSSNRIDAFAIARIVCAAALLIVALLTPGFVSRPSIAALLTTVSFVGCVAVGMTLITISGNIMSFSLGATVGSSAMVFILAMNSGGLVFGLAAACCFGALLSGMQGLLVGFLGANPIIVSIAALALITGFSEAFAQQGSIYPNSSAHYAQLKFQLGVVPSEFLAFVALALVAQIVLGYTAFGRRIYMIGSSRRAAQAAGIVPWRVVGALYAVAGICAAISGILLAVRYGGASMTYGVGYDYDAVAAVLVGGTLMRGGSGSCIRTFGGVIFIALVKTILLLRGFTQEWQYLFTGLIVFVVVILQPPRSSDQ